MGEGEWEIQTSGCGMNNHGIINRIVHDIVLVLHDDSNYICGEHSIR